MIRRRHTARLPALRLGACVLALCASTAHAEGQGRPVPTARVVDGLHAFVTGAAGAVEAGPESRVALFTLALPLATGTVAPMQVGAHMTLGNQPRKSSAIVFSTVVPF